MTASDLLPVLRAGGAAERDALGAVATAAERLANAPSDAVRDALAVAADPLAALHGIVRLSADAARAGDVPLGPLLRVLGGSATLAAALAAEGDGWPALFGDVLTVAARDARGHGEALAAAGVAGALPRAALLAGLRRHRRRELVRIGGRDLLGLATVDETVREISALAEGLLETAVFCARARLAAEWGEALLPGRERPADFVVLGMGKLGGEELNYSSDVDLVYVYERDGEQRDGRTLAQFFTRLAEEVTRALREPTEDGLCFRVDLRLRPGGGEGPVTVSLPAALSYYETWGQTWERAVWLKARPVAGARALGETLLAELLPFVYRRYLDFATLDDLKEMKRRVDASLRNLDEARRNVKLGRGGIREVEFVVQAQQLVHGGKDERLRVRGTLPALAALAAHGYVDGEVAERLAAAYRFLRDVEHKIQMVDERQTQVVPRDPAAQLALARRLGFIGPDGVAAFWAAHARHTEAVHGAFATLFHGAEEERRREDRPELRVLVEELDQEERATWGLARLGFRDVESAYRDLRLLRDGPPHAPASPRRRAALATLAPALLAEIARSAAPERALHHLATFISTVGARTSYLYLLLENPAVMRLLVQLFAGSEFLSAFFLRHPELLDNLVRADLVRVTRTRDEMAAELATRMSAATDLESSLDALRRFRHEEFLRIGVHDLYGSLTTAEVGTQLTALAEACLGAAAVLARHEVLARAGLPAGTRAENLAVVGMGKLGSGELNYASDLDLIFIYDAGEPAGAVPHEVFTRIAQRVISALQTPTREGIAYRIDTRLRPSGNQGPLVSSLEAFARYHEQSARVWERQALIKARVVVAPSGLADAFSAVVEGFVYGTGLSDAEATEIARIRERIARERGGATDIKTGRGGLVDVEFLVQLLQLRHGYAHPDLRVRDTPGALAALAGAGVLADADAGVLAAGWAFLRALENRLRIERDQPVEAIDEDPDALLGLARRLGYAGDEAAAVAALRADHARHRAAIRAVYERMMPSASLVEP